MSSDQHPESSDLPEGLRTREEVLASCSGLLSVLTELCHVKPTDPDACLCCLAYDEVVKRDREQRDEIRTAEQRVIDAAALPSDDIEALVLCSCPGPCRHAK